MGGSALQVGVDAAAHQPLARGLGALPVRAGPRPKSTGPERAVEACRGPERSRPKRGARWPSSTAPPSALPRSRGDHRPGPRPEGEQARPASRCAVAVRRPSWRTSRTSDSNRESGGRDGIAGACEVRCAAAGSRTARRDRCLPDRRAVSSRDGSGGRPAHRNPAARRIPRRPHRPGTCLRSRGRRPGQLRGSLGPSCVLTSSERRW